MEMKLPKIEINAPVVIWYTVISFAVLLLGYATGHETTTLMFTCYRTELSDPLMWIRMLTYVFGHSDATHFINNFFLITLLGPMLEEKFGSKRLLQMMLLTALVGGAANLLLTTSGLRGASGIVFMFIILCSCTTVQSGKIPLTLVLVVVIYIGQEIITGVTAVDNVSHMTHILGGFCGIVFGLFYNSRHAKQ